MLKFVKLNKITAIGNCGYFTIFCVKNAKIKIFDFKKLGLKTNVKSFYLPLVLCKFFRWADKKINYLKFGNYGKSY